MAHRGPDLAVLGNLLLDDVIYADGTTRMSQPGGAAMYAALGAALWGVSVGIVTRLGDDYPRPILDRLAERGVDLDGARTTGAATLRTWLLYEGRRRRVVHRLDGPTHEDVSPRTDDIPATWKPRTIHLAPMPWRVQRRLIESLGPLDGLHLSADPYELLTPDALADWSEVFGRVDTLFFSEDEMQIPGGLEDPAGVLAELRGERLKTVLYKRGPGGGIVYEPGRGVSGQWTARAAGVVDPTGAGDAFAGGVLAGRLLGDPLARALDRGVVSASFALSGTGADGLFEASPPSAADRLGEWFGAPNGEPGGGAT